MPIIANGGNATIAVLQNQILTVQCQNGAEFTYENPVGTRLLDSGSNNVFGPFAAAGNVKVSSVQGPIFYEVATVPVVDATLVREAANTLAQRNGANAQAFNLYNTYTDASNYERLGITWSGNIATISADALGTGTARMLQIRAGGNNPVQIGNGSGFALNVGSVSVAPNSNGTVFLGLPATGWKQIYMAYTNTGTVGAVTINNAAGRVNIAAAGTSIVVTNSLVTVNSHIFATVTTNDATAYIRNVIPAAGSFTINLGAAATAQTSIDFFVVSAD